MFNLTGFEKHGDYLKVGDNYILFISESGLFRVNGQDTSPFLYNQSKQYMLSELPEVYKVSKAYKELSHYLDSEGNIYTEDEVQEVFNKYQGDDGDYYYPNLDTEFAHRKELEVVRNYERIYNEYPEVLTPVEVRCVGDVVDTGSRFIENALSYGAAGFSNGNLYKLDFSGITADELSRFVKENDLNDKYKPSSHSNVHYAQIEDKYVMTNLPYSRQDKWGFAKTLQEAQEKEASVRKQVRNHLNIVVLGTSITLKGKSVASMYGDIERWINRVVGLEVKQKSNADKTSLLWLMRETKDTLHTLIEEK